MIINSWTTAPHVVPDLCQAATDEISVCVFSYESIGQRMEQVDEKSCDFYFVIIFKMSIPQYPIFLHKRNRNPNTISGKMILEILGAAHSFCLISVELE